MTEREKTNVGAMVRSVSYYGQREHTNRLRNPYQNSPEEMTTLAISAGNPRAAKVMMLEWFESHLDAVTADPEAYTLQELLSLRATFQYEYARIDGMTNLERSELSLLSESVAPSVGRPEPIAWSKWITPTNLQWVFNTKVGREISLDATTGYGKTNFKVLSGEHWTPISDHHYVIHNVNLLKPFERKEQWHKATKYSELIRFTAERLLEDPDSQFLHAFDEPAQSLRATNGKTEAQEMWELHRGWKRKLNHTILYGWQEPTDVWSTLRKAPELVHATKKDVAEITFDVPMKRGRKVVELTELPMCRSEYNTKGGAHLDMDVDMHKFKRILGQDKPTAAVMQDIIDALDDKSLFLKDFQPTVDKGDVKAAALASIREAPADYVGGTGKFSRDRIFAALQDRGVTFSQAQVLKLEMDQVAADVARLRGEGQAPSKVRRKIDVPKAFIEWVDSR